MRENRYLCTSTCFASKSNIETAVIVFKGAMITVIKSYNYKRVKMVDAKFGEGYFISIPEDQLNQCFDLVVTLGGH